VVTQSSRKGDNPPNGPQTTTNGGELHEKGESLTHHIHGMLLYIHDEGVGVFYRTYSSDVPPRPITGTRMPARYLTAIRLLQTRDTLSTESWDRGIHL